MKNSKLQPFKIFKWIKNLIFKFNLTVMIRHLCEIANISISGYYRFLKTESFRNAKEDEDLKIRNIIFKAFNHRGYKKGSISIKMTLKNKFKVKMNRNKIQIIMKKYNIVFPIRKANSYKRMAKATQEHRVVDNKLNREFKQNIPRRYY
jgi:hypothetical protein